MHTVDDVRGDRSRPFRRRPGGAIGEFTLSVAEAAEQVGVSEYTVRRWIRQNQIPAKRLPGTKPWKLRPIDVEAILSNPVSSSSSRAPEAPEGVLVAETEVPDDAGTLIVPEVVSTDTAMEHLDLAATIVVTPVAL